MHADTKHQGQQMPSDNQSPEKIIKELAKMLDTGAIRFCSTSSTKGDDFRRPRKQIQLIYLNEDNNRVVFPIGPSIEM